MHASEQGRSHVSNVEGDETYCESQGETILGFRGLPVGFTDGSSLEADKVLSNWRHVS